jgi:hypothetical protein
MIIRLDFKLLFRLHSSKFEKRLLSKNSHIILVSPVSSIYNWSKNFSHSPYEKSEAKMAAIDVQ